MKYILIFIAFTVSAVSQPAFPVTIIQNHGGAVTPILPVRDSLLAWYRADSLAMAVPKSSGDTTWMWRDVSGGDYHVTNTTAAQKPVYWSATDSTYDLIRFDGTDDRLFTNASFGTAWPTNAQPNTAFVVVKDYKPTVTALWADFSGAFTQIGIFAGVSEMFAGTALNAGAIVADSIYIFGARFNGTTSSIYRNGLLYSGNAGVQNFSSTLYVGAAHTGSSFADASIYEIIIYNGLLTAAEMVQVNQYLASKYGVTLP